MKKYLNWIATKEKSNERILPKITDVSVNPRKGIMAGVSFPISLSLLPWLAAKRSAPRKMFAIKKISVPLNIYSGKFLILRKEKQFLKLQKSRGLQFQHFVITKICVYQETVVFVLLKLRADGIWLHRVKQHVTRVWL